MLTVHNCQRRKLGLTPCHAVLKETLSARLNHALLTCATLLFELFPLSLCRQRFAGDLLIVKMENFAPDDLIIFVPFARNQN
jgi:hypothetical protein